MKRLIIPALSIYIGISAACQQTLDILTISGRYGFPRSYDSVLTKKATEVGSMLNLVAPVKFSEHTIWYNSLNYFYFNVTNGETLPPEIANPIHIHGFLLRTGLYQKFSKGRGLQLFFAPRLMSDLNNIDGKHFQYGGMAMFEKKFRDNLTMSFGAMYNHDFFGPYLVPLINLDWQLSERWSVAGLLPVYAKINYKVNDWCTAGISHFGLVTTYYLGDPDCKGDYIERKSIDLSLFGRFRIAGNIYIEGRAGHSLGRSYTQYEADQKVDFSLPLAGFGDDREQKNIVFKDGVILDLRVVYNIPIPEDK
ncbi:MAG: hypothetical protein JXB24_02085 [Bacteroidales bacterium]|nr:hypothetical protein [Bacteroidales bacterium]